MHSFSLHLQDTNPIPELQSNRKVEDTRMETKRRFKLSVVCCILAVSTASISYSSSIWFVTPTNGATYTAGYQQTTVHLNVYWNWYASGPGWWFDKIRVQFDGAWLPDNTPPPVPQDPGHASAVRRRRPGRGWNDNGQWRLQSSRFFQAPRRPVSAPRLFLSSPSRPPPCTPRRKPCRICPCKPRSILSRSKLRRSGPKTPPARY